MRRPATKSEILLLLLWAAVLIGVALAMPVTATFFARTFPDVSPPVYARQSFIRLLLAHAELVGAASLASAAIGIALGIAVTRPRGREFRPMVAAIAALGQSFPPVAVLALAVPAMGYGAAPVFFALALYGLLPILQNTTAGLESIPAAVQEAALGSGFNPWQSLWLVELPLAAPAILAGIRTSVTINIGTAALGSTVGAVTLGTPIIDGLVSNKLPFVLQGALVIALLAIVVDRIFERLQRWRTY
jgi:osmoprotectant transport system permease protein